MNAALLLSLAILAANDAANFDNDILPILTKAGCNTAACHGSAAGRGGFKLSLYGGDPTSDYDAIVRQYEGRRINHARPVDSLLLAKPTGELEHGGDVRLDSDGPQVATIVRWISDGARRGTASSKLVRLELTPSAALVETIPAQVQLQATAIYDDGSRRAVNDLALFAAEDDAAVGVSESGKAKLLRRGRHNVMVRFLTEVAAVTITAPLHEVPIDLAAAPRGNFIDDEIYATLKQLRLPPSSPADELTLLRRLRFDLTGRLPTPVEIANWELQIANWKLKNPDSAFRIPQSAIDNLLASDDFTEYWTHQLGQWLRVGPAGSDEKSARVFHDWIESRLALRKPLNETVAAMIVADGNVRENGPANFYRGAPDARGQAEYFSEVLMGVRLRCANCHNHPLDRWTQDDYHGLAATFGKLQRGPTIRFLGRGEVSHPATGEAAVPKLPGGEFLSVEGDHRQVLADWLVDEQNPYFARMIVNRLWAAMMGRGLVEPVDDFRATNPATHPRLLALLADDFIEHDYDLRHTLRLITSSAAYARSSEALPENESDERFYSHALRKPLSPEVLLDAMHDVVDVPNDRTPRTRAIALLGPVSKSPALDLLGRCDREASCGTGGAASGNLSRQLALLNGDLINAKLRQKDNRLSHLMDEHDDNRAVVRELYLLALSRQPSDDEAAYWKKQLTATNETQRRAELEDFLWSLLSCDEFAKRY